MYRIALLLNGRYVDSREFSTAEHCTQSLYMYAAQGYEVKYTDHTSDPATGEVTTWSLVQEVEQ